MEGENDHSHNIAELEPRLYKGAALVVAGGNSPPSPGGIPGHRIQVRRAAIGCVSGPGCGTIADEAHTSTHQWIAATATCRHVPTSHATQHPERYIN